MEAKHTPGPWEPGVQYDDEFECPILTTDGREVGAAKGETEEECAANAQVFASAPQLAEAVAGLLDQLAGIGIYIPGEDGGHWAGAEGLDFEPARAALRKAGLID